MEYGNKLSSENKFLIKTYGNLKNFLSEDLTRNTLTNIEKINIGRLKVVHNQINQMHCRKLSATIIPNCR